MSTIARNITAGFILAGFVACQQPDGIEVRESAPSVQVTSLVTSDTMFAMSPIDSNAILPGDEREFVGSLVVNNVRFDAGQGIQSFSFARVFVGDRNRPVSGPRGPIGFHGFHLGTVLLNNVPMLERLHRLPGIDPSVIAGFEYVGGPDFEYLPGETYTWSSDSIGAPSLSIDAPEVITVRNPAGGSVININEELELNWTSEGQIAIIVSRVLRVGVVRPMLYVEPFEDGHAVIPRKALQLLPRNATYLLTFVRSNRSEVAVTRPFFEGTLLLQAASVHNIQVELR